MYLHTASSLFSFTSSLHQKPMTKTTLHIFFFSLFLFYTPICVGVVSSSVGGQRSLKVSHDQFLGSIELVDNHLQDVSSNLQQLQTNIVQYSDYPRLPSAISTCLQLLKLSTEELSWCVSALKSPEGKYEGTGNLGADLSTWLGAVVANLDTCKDGFEDTYDINVKGQILIGLEKLNSLISDMLNQVVETVAVDHFTTHGQLPSWVKPSDEEFLLTNEVPFDVVVALDGTGNYSRIMDAVNAAPEFSSKRFVIHIKKGTYNETVFIEKKKKNLMMIGDGDATIISGNLSYLTNLTTYQTATFTVVGERFIAKYISFMNTAGPENYQAVAVVSNSDCSVFYKCEFFGFQDTLYVHSNRQFYKECNIRGTVDFIFGYGAAVFQNCLVLVTKGLEKQTNTITAQGRKTTVPNGFSFQFCNISADADLLSFLNSTQTFLGRPWKEYATVVFMQSYLSDVVSPQGWCEWNGTPVYLDTLFYAEYHNYGLGAEVKNRVNWSTYHVLNDPSQVNNFTVAQLISGNQWLPLTGVPYTPGLGDQNITIGQ